jgi:putative sporulation protein YyaC
MIFSANINDFKKDSLDLLKISLAYDISNLFKKAFKEDKDVVFVCFGTDKVFYDAFGPIIGSSIKERLCFMPKLKVYGDLDNNVDALNTISTINLIKEKEKDNIIIAVDATAVLNKQSIGKLMLNDKCVSPGAGAGKKLKSIGDFSITLATCLATEKNNKYKVDSKNTISIEDMSYAVDLLIEVLNMACDSAINYSLRSLT